MKIVTIIQLDQGPAIRRLLAEHDLDAEKFKVLVWVVVLPVKILRVKWQNVMHQKAKQDVATETEYN